MKIFISTLLAFCFLFVSPMIQADQNEAVVEYFPSADSFPLSEAVRVGDTLYLSGELGYDKSLGTLAPGGIEAETKQIMENINAKLIIYGSSLDHVVKCTIMIADMRELGQFNVIYRNYFQPGRFPARSAFGANALAFGARVEVDCIAIIPK